MTDRLFTPDEVAEFYRVTRQTIYRWVKSGTPMGFEPLRIGHLLRFRQSEMPAQPTHAVRTEVRAADDRRRRVSDIDRAFDALDEDGAS